MGRSSGLSRSAIVIKLLQSLKHVKEHKKAKNTLAFLLLLDEDIPETARDQLWMRNMVDDSTCQKSSGFDLFRRHCQGATELCYDVDNRFHPIAGKAAPLSEVTNRIRRKRNELHALEAPGLPYRRMALLPGESLQTLLEWCSEQVEGTEYRSMLGSPSRIRWTESPDRTSFLEFENTVLFCFLWQKFRDVQKRKLQKGLIQDDEIVSLVDKLEQSLEIPPAVIFATVLTLRPRVGAESYYSCSSDYMADWAASSLMELTNVVKEIPGCLGYHIGVDGLHVAISHGGIETSFEAYEEHTSLDCNIEATNAQRRFRKKTQKYVRLLAKAEYSINMSPRILEGLTPHFPTNPVTGRARSPNEESAVVDGPAATPTGSGSPAVRPESANPLTVHETNRRPESAACSSLTSSKASLRSFQRLSRAADLLFKRRGEDWLNQLPSEVMDRDSHSSWSLRQLTGLSYLSFRSDLMVDGLPGEDTIMEDASSQT